jgi:hypothetical protein
MGSLILLLLVLDRRAKVVARAKERERQEAVLAQYSKADRERMAAYEQKRRELRQRLQTQEAALHANLDSKQSELQRKKNEANLERNRTAELKARLAALREVLAREQEGYEQEQRRTASISIKKHQVLSEHEALARELVNLENALSDVIAFRKRQSQTYSLVPYLGKSGENRRPIYVECQADQVIVHPEHLIAKTVSWDGSSQLQELTQTLAGRLKANSAETKQKPYVLFLVRPDGIATYYRVMGALGIRNIDSGYELIDADWALDFGEADGHSPAQPWVADPRTPGPGAIAGTLRAGPRSTSAARGVPQNGLEMFQGNAPVVSRNAAKPGFAAVATEGTLYQPGNGSYTNSGTPAIPGGTPGVLAGAGSTGGQSPGGLGGQLGLHGYRSGNGLGANGDGGGTGGDTLGVTGIPDSNGGPSGMPGTGSSGPENQSASGYASRGVAQTGPGNQGSGTGTANGDGSQWPSGSGATRSGGRQGPASLSDLLNAQNAAGGRGPGNGNGGLAAAGQSSGQPSVPGAGVAPPGIPGAVGAARPNTGDSTFAFSESGQRGTGGTQGDQKLLPLPGQYGQPGSPGAPGSPQLVGDPRAGSPSASGSVGSNGTANNGLAGSGSGGSGIPGTGTSSGIANGGPGLTGGGSGSGSLNYPSPSALVNNGAPGGGSGAGSPSSGGAGEAATGGSSVAGGGGATSPNAAPSGQMVNGAAGGAGSPDAGASSQMIGSQSVVVTPGAPRPANADAPGSPDGAGSGSPGGSASGGSASGLVSDGGDAGSGGSGGGSAPGPPDPLARLLPRTKRPSAPASFRVEGNRDLPIVLECRANEVVMVPTDRHWQTADLERNTAARAAFADAVQQWIARRQATVREGQTPYRPQLRFRVSPDGLRAYYAAYPLLEKLSLPMRREELETEPPPPPRVRPE